MPDFFNFNRLLGLGLTPPPGMIPPPELQPSYGNPDVQAFTPDLGSPRPYSPDFAPPDLLAGPPPKPGFKEILKTGLQTFLYSLGRGLQEGGGLRGAGAALTAPLELQELQRQRRFQALQLASRLQEEQARAARDYAMAHAYWTPKEDLSITPYEAFLRGKMSLEDIEKFTKASTPAEKPREPSGKWVTLKGGQEIYLPAPPGGGIPTLPPGAEWKPETTTKEPAPSFEQKTILDAYAAEHKVGNRPLTATETAAALREDQQRKISDSIAAQTKEQKDQTVETMAKALLQGDVTTVGAISGFGAPQIRANIFARAMQMAQEQKIQLPPNWAPMMKAKFDTVVDFFDTSKPKSGANQLRSFGTFLEHAGEAKKAIDAIYLSQSGYFNKSLNWWRSNMRGRPEYGALIAALEPVRNEMSAFLAGGYAPFEKDKAAARDILSDDAPISVINAALSTWGRVAKERSNELNFSYKRIVGRDISAQFSPEAIAGAKSLGVDLLSVGGGQGATGTPSTFGAIPGARRVR